VIPVVPVYLQRREARRALVRGYPRRLGLVRCCPSPQAVQRLLAARLVDAVVVDVKAGPELWLEMPRRYPRIPLFALSAFRPEDGKLVADCQRAGFAGVLIEPVDHAVAAEWVARRTAQQARRRALADAPRLLRLKEPLQLRVWEEVWRRVAEPTKTADLARVLRVTREHLSREFAAGGAPNLKRVIDLVRTACAADLLGNPAYTVGSVARILGYASPSHLAGAARRVAGASPVELRVLGPRGVLAAFLKGRTRSRL
jgi:AraC-like DNA-binding protein